MDVDDPGTVRALVGILPGIRELRLNIDADLWEDDEEVDIVVVSSDFLRELGAWHPGATTVHLELKTPWIDFTGALLRGFPFRACVQSVSLTASRQCKFDASLLAGFQAGLVEVLWHTPWDVCGIAIATGFEYVPGALFRLGLYKSADSDRQLYRIVPDLGVGWVAVCVENETFYLEVCERARLGL